MCNGCSIKVIIKSLEKGSFKEKQTMKFSLILFPLKQEKKKENVK